ncbi:MAG: hypothetical protein HYY13_09745 [Nitrospirae bacterium]|nr:hypothetical protein [Nitrospirota bacterium]
MTKWLILRSGALPELWGEICAMLYPVPGGILAGLGFDVGLFRTGPDGSPTLSARAEVGGIVHDAAAAPPYVYLAAGSTGLGVLDLRQPDRIRSAVNLGVPGYALVVRVKGTRAFVGLKEGGGLVGLDISRPDKPSVSFSIWRGEDVSDIEFLGPYVVAAVSNRVEIISPSEAGAPKQISRFPLPRRSAIEPIDPLPRDLVLNPPYLYGVNGADGLFVLDLSDPTRPRQVSELTDRGFLESIALFGAKAFVGRKTEHVGIVDLSDPHRPTWKGTLPVFGRTLNSGASADELLLAGGAKGWSIFDTRRDPPARVASYTLPPRAYDVLPDGERIYVASGPLGIKTLRREADGSNTEIARIETAGNSRHLRRVGQDLWVSDTNGGLVIASLEDPDHPAVRTYLNTGNHVWSSLPLGSGLLMAGGRGLSFFVPAPGGFSLASELPLDGYPVDIDAHEDRVYAALISGRVAVGRLEGSSLRWIRDLIPSKPIPRPCTALSVAEGRMIVGDAKGRVYLYDLRNPEEPKLVAKTRVGATVFDIEFDGREAWVAAHKAGLIEIEAIENTLNTSHRFMIGQTVLGVGLSDSEVFAATGDGRVVSVPRPQ